MPLTALQKDLLAILAGNRSEESHFAGGEGAGKGVASGALASGFKKGQAVTINPGTLLEFRLQQPLTVKVTR